MKPTVIIFSLVFFSDHYSVLVQNQTALRKPGESEWERQKVSEKVKSERSHWPTILMMTSALSSPAGLVTVMVYRPSSSLSAPSITKLLRVFLVSTRTRPSASATTYHTRAGQEQERQTEQRALLKRTVSHCCHSGRWFNLPTLAHVSLFLCAVRWLTAGYSDWRTKVESVWRVCECVWGEWQESSLFFLTWSPFIQHTVGAGSPVISTSRRSLFPATTMMVFLLPEPLVSRWILGGSLHWRRRWEDRGHSGQRENKFWAKALIWLFVLWRFSKMTVCAVSQHVNFDDLFQSITFF